MNRKKLWFFVLTTIVLTSLISGCIGGGQFGAPSADSSVTIKGVVVAPDNDCFTDTCANPSIIEGEPLPNADIILKGENHTLTGKTRCAGDYQISGLTDEGYILYANRGEVWVKKAISPITGDGGEANYKTTAQVIIWEIVENKFPGSIPIKDIPDAIPFENIPEEFYNAVKAALSDCRDAQQDGRVISLAKSFVEVNFGAVFVPCVEPTSENNPTPTPTPTPTNIQDILIVGPSITTPEPGFVKINYFNYTDTSHGAYLHVQYKLEGGIYGNTYEAWCIDNTVNVHVGDEYYVMLHPANSSNPSIGSNISKVWGVIKLGDQFAYSIKKIQDEIWFITNNYGSHDLDFDGADPNATGNGIVCYPIQ